jgi:ABC-type microcin C transport system duplicated ATPase subunit YejF
LTRSTSASTSGKFTKTSQKQQNVMAENIKKLLPRWDIPNVIAEMDKVANQPNLTPDEKRQKMAQVLQNFERDIAPLSKYLAANGLTAKKPN